mmetsp:Transcript_13142/g.32474  ORF Transcript_13142/g.32474 Transcript_13142/m.32474 type:complete len:283 (+) Transcript_13142:41-889(+)
MPPPPVSAEEASKLVRGADKVLRKADDFPPPLVSTGLKPVFDENNCLWIVEAVYPMIPYILGIPTTMTVYRAPDGTLTLFNALRVEESVEDEILKLGRIAHVVKLGQFHGSSDAYYVRAEKFNAPKYWTVAGGSCAEGMAADVVLAPSGPLPVEGATFYQLDGQPFPESIMLLPSAHGIICMATDCLMHLVSTSRVPIVGRLMLNWFGFVANTANVPEPAPLWLRNSVRLCGKEQVQRWFDDILAMEFAHVICAHGPPAVKVSREAIGAACTAKIDKTPGPS